MNIQRLQRSQIMKTINSTFVFALFCGILFHTEMTTAEELAEATRSVNSYYGEYNTKDKQAGLPSASLEAAKLEEWTAPTAANKPYRLGILFPHLKDPYFLAVNYGILTEAKKLGVGMKLLTAGGYGELEKQKKQFKQLIKEGVDGIILASISYTALDEEVKAAKKHGIPVVEVINDIYSPDIKAKALVSFFEMGSRSAEFIIEDAAYRGNVKVAFFPGPQGSGWAPDTLKGFFSVQRKYQGKIKLLPPKWGDTGYETQHKLLHDVLQKHKDIDYIVGNAVAAEEAVGILKEMGLSEKIKIVSTYMIPTIFEKIEKGEIQAAPSDVTVKQGEMAVDMMVRLLNGEKPGVDFPFRSGPLIPIVTHKNIQTFSYEDFFGAKDFKPVFNFQP